MKEYKSNLLLVLGELLRNMLITFVAYMFLRMLIISFDNIWLLEIIAVLLFIANIVYIFLVRYMKVTITDEEIIMKKILKTETFSRKEYTISSLVHKEYVNGIRNSVNRQLVFMSKGEFTKEIPNISKKNFDEIVATIRKSQIIEDEKEDIIRFSKYKIPKEKMLEEHKAFMKKFFVIVSIAMAIITIFILIKVNENTPQLITPLFVMHLVLVISLLFLVPGITIIVTYSKKKKTIPSDVIITTTSVRVDDREFLLKELDKVIAYPPSYQGNVMGNGLNKIYLVKGHKKTFINLGPTLPVGIYKTIFQDYEKLVNELEIVCLKNKTDFILDL
jgi:hypothetical protein